MSEDISVLAAELKAASRNVARGLYDAYKEGGEIFAEEWRSNARVTSGAHGKHYPASITSETLVGLGIIVDTGPETARRQGGMGPGFELGSRNQPPHLDGAKAAMWVAPRIERLADAAIGFALP